jgi:hypothetical protein
VTAAVCFHFLTKKKEGRKRVGQKAGVKLIQESSFFHYTTALWFTPALTAEP